MNPENEAATIRAETATKPAAPGELALLFLRLGTTAFGGPAAHIAMMQQEVVERRQWLMKAEFLDLLGASNLIPGPSSTELAIHIGYRKAGWRGLFLAGTCFILPAFLLVMILAWAYVRFGQLPQIAGALTGVKAVVVAIVAQALWNLGRTAIKTRFLGAIGVGALFAASLGASPLLVLAASGLITASAFRAGKKAKEKQGGENIRFLLLLLLTFCIVIGLPAALSRYGGISSALGLTSLGLVFVKLGSVVYGSGYVLLAFLRDELVTKQGWLTTGQLLDAVAIGQVTPGPVFTTATFIGYILVGPKGAIVATLGIFLPAFAFVALSGPLVARVRQSATAGAFLDGVNVASFALMALVTAQLAQNALKDVTTIVLALASLLLLLHWRVNSAWLVLGGAIVGMAHLLLK